MTETKEWQQRTAGLRTRLAAERKHAFQKGRSYVCPGCGKRRLKASETLRRRIEAPGYVVELANLHGAECHACGITVLEAFEEVALEKEAGQMWRSHHGATVSKVSGQKLGMYFPKDVIASMGLHPKEPLAIYVLGPDTLVVHRGTVDPAREPAK